MLFIKVFKSRFPSTIFLGLLMAAGLWLMSFGSEHPASIEFSFFTVPLNGWSWLWRSIGVLLLFVEAFLLNHFINEADIFEERANLVMLLYITIGSISPKVHGLTPVLVANLFSILALGQVLKIYNQQKVFTLDFNTGFLTGMAAICYFPSAVMMISLFVTLALVRSVTPKDVMIGIVGFLVPFIYLYAFQFLFDFNWSSSFDHWLAPSDLACSRELFIGVIIVLVAAVIGWIRSLGKVTMRRRNHYMIIATTLFLMALPIAFYKDARLFLFSMAVIPGAVLLVGLITSFRRRWMQELIYLCLLGMVISFQLFG